MTDPGWVVTCDPGTDDAIALAVAAGHPGCRVMAVVAGAGNVDAPTAWRNATGMARLLRLDVPVGHGDPRTLDGMAIERAGDAHGRDGLSGLAHLLPDRPSAPDMPDAPDGRALVQGAVIALGPLSDVARARRAGRPVGPLVWMGGTLADGTVGDGPTGEFNAGIDPAATDEVLDTVEDMAVVPIDVSRLVTFGAADIDRWSTAAGPGARLCAALARARLHGGTAALHDPVAVVAALDPDLFAWERRRLRGATGGSRPPGTLVPAPERTGRATARVAVALDIPAVRERVITAVLRT